MAGLSDPSKLDDEDEDEDEEEEARGVTGTLAELLIGVGSLFWATIMAWTAFRIARGNILCSFMFHPFSVLR